MADTNTPKRKKDGRIFINYRRGDSTGYAGRLSDTLETYFGGGRVFRDVEDIAGGSSFGDVIDQTLHAADAVIILIGSKWLTVTGEDGTRRIDDPNDWVTREIAATLEKGTPIFPVLIDGAIMPRAEELPESVRPIVERNAVHISDQRWSNDVTRLAQVIALDIPGSLAERKLAIVNRLISASLFLAVLVTLFGLTRNLTVGAPLTAEKLAGVVANTPPDGEAKLFTLEAFSDTVDTPLLASNKTPYFPYGPSALTFIVILCCVVALAFFSSLVDRDRRRYVYAAIVTGGLGCFTFFVLMIFVVTEFEPIVNVFGSTITAFAMLALMSVSGLKAK